MIFQAFIQQECGGKSAEAVRLFAAQGHYIDYQRAHRWYRQPCVMPLTLARAFVAASGGKCTLEELIDLDVIIERFDFAASEPADELAYVSAQLRRRETELTALEQLMSKLSKGKSVADLQRDVTSLRKRQERLQARVSSVDAPPPRKRGRPSTVAPEARKRGRRKAPAAAA